MIGKKVARQINDYYLKILGRTPDPDPSGDEEKSKILV
jgi:hypothetical protein